MPEMSVTYQPVVRACTGALSGAALVGSHAVVLGWDLDPTFDRSSLLGFSIRRMSLLPETGKAYRVFWLPGQKRFREIVYDEGVSLSSYRAPFQRFRWNDYTVDSRYVYRYDIYPVVGTPDSFERLDPLTIEVRPTPPSADGLSVYVNRGVTAAYAYLTRFDGQPPELVADGAAYHWLSRGLKESLLSLVASASVGDALHVAIFEFHDLDVAHALAAAVDRGVDVRIVYHKVKADSHTVLESLATLERAHLTEHAVGRTKIKISHNKFVVLVSADGPQAVWTGSANFTRAGFNLQTNVGLIFMNPTVASAYEDYFQLLMEDPASGRRSASSAHAQDRVEALMAQANEQMAGEGQKLFLSPVRNEHIVDAACDLVASARTAVLVSAPFGLDTRIVDALGSNSDDILEYGLANTTARKKIAKLNRKNTRFFTPSRLETYMGRRWDAKAFGAHKIHAKLMIIDPWSDAPTVLVGSANFSKASCRYNDENALLIRRNQRLSSILATEFLRMWDHYKSRAFINLLYSDTVNEVRYLASDGSWTRTAYDPTSPSHKYRDRLVFAGNE